MSQLGAIKTEYQPDIASPLVIVDVGEFLARNIPPREMLLDPIIPAQGLALLYSMRGVGKTHVALGIAYAAASGGHFLRWSAPRPRRVLYLDGEMPAKSMQDRIASIVAGAEQEPPSPEYLRFITPDFQEDSFPDLASEDGQAAIEPHLEGVDLVIVDNLSTLCRYGRENEAESWGPVQTWILSLRRRGISVLLVHHANKNGGQRGTSRREDVLDTVIALSRPEGYTSEEGARFEVHLEKARHIVGDEAKPFESRLDVRDGASYWTTRGLEDVELQQVVDLTADGESVCEIADKLDLSRSKVQRLRERAREKGMLDE